MANCIVCKSELDEGAGIVVTEGGKKYNFCQFSCLGEFCCVVEEYDGYETNKGDLLEMTEDSLASAYKLYKEVEELDEEIDEEQEDE